MRFQFKLWNLFATFALVAIWLTLCSLFFRDRVPMWVPEMMLAPIWMAIVALPFVAIGTLLGRIWAGLVVGCAVALVSFAQLPRIV
jgi:hypothetical protein